MAKTTLIKKEIDSVTSFLYDRKEVVTAPMWPNNSAELRNIYTSSNQPHHQKIYYRTIFSDSTRTGSLDVDFSIAYGHYAGSGSSTGSYGLITSGSYGLSDPKFPVSESMVIYSQYRNLLYDFDKRKYLSDGKFRFYGLSETNLGVYDWEFDSVTDGVTSEDKVNIPDIKSFGLNKIISLSSAKKELDFLLSKVFYFINSEGKLFKRIGFQFSPITGRTFSVEQIGINDTWKDVSSGINPDLVDGHVLAIKTDGTLWAWGRNNLGQLGIGYISNDIISQKRDPLQIGRLNNWEKVYGGYGYSFAINSLGELYAWGDNSSGILGTGGTVSEYFPVRVGNNTWKKISIGNVNTGNESLVTIFGIAKDGTLWGWGDNSNKKLIDGGDPFIFEPVQLDTDTDWHDISCGEEFVIAIKDIDKKLYGWGSTGVNGELLAVNTPTTTIFSYWTYSISDKKFLTDTPTSPDPVWPARLGWQEVSCGSNFTFAINSNENGKLYCWGDNSKLQLGIDTLSIFGLPYADIIWQASELSGWDKVSVSNLNGAAAINTPNKVIESIVSDDIYVINLNRWNFRDKVDSGNWQLSLTSVYTGSGQQILYSPPFTSPIYNTVTLVDESINLVGTEFESPMYDLCSKGGTVYGVYSGSIESGINKSAENCPYGLFFPENGIIILNGELLTNSNFKSPIKIQTRRTPATSSGAFPYSSNADLLYASMKGAMVYANRPFIANTVETKMPTYCFIRINNDEFNYTMNRTKYQKDDSFLVKDKFRMVPYPFTYITTIGLYNDNDDLLAVAKLSKPIFKNPSTELVVKIKLDI